MHFYALEGGIKIKHKKIILTLAMLFVMLLAVSTVSAMDNVTDVVSIDANNDAVFSTCDNVINDIVSVDEETDFVQSNNENQSVDAGRLSTNEENILSTSPGTFRELAHEIDFNYDDVLNLRKNYTFVESDSAYINGIPIPRPMTINGNGFTIDAKGQSLIFLVSANNVTIKNITFINSKSNSSDYAIYWNGGANGVICDCNFMNNTPEYGLIHWFKSTNGTIYNCNFMNNLYSIRWENSDNGVIHNCNFVDNYADTIRWLNSANGTVHDCNFVNSSNSNIGWSNSANGTVYNCNFTNNIAGGDGAAIHWANSDNGTVHHSYFVNNTVAYDFLDGGAIYWDESDNGVISDCYFENNSVKYNFYKTHDGYYISHGCGGAIFWNRAINGIIRNSIFKNNFAYWNYGFHICNRTPVTLENNKFTIEPVLKVSDYMAPYKSNNGLSINVTLNGRPLNGTLVVLKIYKNNVYYRTINCYSGSNNVLDLNVGVYNATCIVVDQQHYNEVVKVDNVNPVNITLTIVKSNSTTYLTANQYDDYVMLTAVVSPIATGKVTFTFNGTDYNETINTRGVANLRLFGLTNGNYTVKATYNGNNNIYPSTSTNITFILNKTFIEPEVNISPLDSPSEDGSINVTLPIDATGTVTLTINDKDYPFDVVNGIAKVFIPDLDSGDYPYTITYSGDRKYSSVVSTGNLKIEKICKSIVAYDMNITYGNEYDFIATFYYADGSPLSNKFVSFFVRNVSSVSELARTDSNGVAMLQLGLQPGEYEIISYNGQTDESRINKIIVKMPEPKPIDENDIVIPTLDNNGLSVIKLPSDASGTITLNIGGKNYNFDVINGIANVKVPDLDNGTYPYVIIYSGDTKYLQFSKNGILSVNKPSEIATPTNPTNPNTPTTPAKSSTPTTTTKPVAKTIITLKAVKVKKSAKKLILQATLKQGKKALSGKKVTFKFNGKTYKVKTNKKGVAKVTIKKNVLKKLKAGKKVKYQASYGKVTAKKIAKVKK